MDKWGLVKKEKGLWGWGRGPSGRHIPANNATAVKLSQLKPDRKKEETYTKKKKPKKKEGTVS